MNLLKAFTQFLEQQKSLPAGRQASKATVKNYRADVSHFIRWYEAAFSSVFSPSAITHQVIELYKKAHSGNEAKLAASSLERHLSSLRKFFHFCKIEGLCAKDPFEELKNKDQRMETDPWKLKDFKNYLYVYNAAHLTIKNYLIDVKQFLSWAEEVTGVKDAWDVHEKDVLAKLGSSLVEEYKHRLLTQAILSPASINRKLSSIRKYMKWGSEAGFIKQAAGVLNILRDTNLPAGRQGHKAFTGFEARVTDKTISKPLEIDTRPLYSSFPPIRLVQKSIKGFSLLLEAVTVLPIVKIVQKLFPQPVFKNANVILSEAKNLRSFAKAQDDTPVKNIPKEFYAPVSVQGATLFKQMWHHARYTRPKWYKRYHSYPITQYFHLAILMIFMSGAGFMLYRVFVEQPKRENPALAAAAPLRILSFQGRLTDATDTPITTGKQLRLIMYNSAGASASARLWEEVRTVTPDADGVFSVLLGANGSGGNAGLCNNGSPTATPATGACGIPQSLFANNSQLYLGVTVDNDAELIPRQQIATVAYATNAEVLQGLPPTTDSAWSAGSSNANAVLALNSSGQIVIPGASTTTFQAVGGQFNLTGQTLLLSTNTGSNGNIVLAPNGTGIIDVTRPLQNTTTSAGGAVLVDDFLAVKATSSSEAAFSVNQNGSGPIIYASVSGVEKFIVRNDGTVTTTGDVEVNGGDLKSTASTFNLLNATSTTINFGAGATTALTVGGSSANVAITDAQWSITGAGVASLTGLTSSGTITFSGFTSNGGPLYTNGSGVLAQVTAGTSTQCLLGGTTPTFGNCASGGADDFFDLASGLLYSGNTTVDFAIGGTASTSAKFAVLNVNSGTPTATLSAGAAGGAYLNATGTLATTAKQSLTLGTTTTGDISLGSDATARNITIGSASTTGLSLTEDNWSIGTGGIITTAGNVNANGGLDVDDAFVVADGGKVSTLDISDTDIALTGASTTFTVTGAFTLTPGGAVLLGDGGDTMQINTSDWDVSTVGAFTLVDSLANTSADLALLTTTSGNITLTTAATTGLVNVLTGNLKVGNGTPGIAQDTEDAYIEGTLEVDGVLYADGGIDTAFTAGSVVFAGTNGVLSQDNSNFFFDDTNNYLGLGTTSPLAALDVRGANATTPAATISAATNVAAMFVDNAGTGDLFTASKSGATKFVVKNSGNVGVGTNLPTATLEVSGDILLTDQAASQRAIQIGGASSGNEGGELQLLGSSTNSDWFIDNFAGTIRMGPIGADKFTFDTSGNLTTVGDIAVNGDDITSDSNLSLKATGYTRIGDTATPSVASADDDLFVEGDLEIAGGTATMSATTNTLSLGKTGTLQTQDMTTLAIGGSTTGNVVIDSGSSSITLSDNTTVVDNNWIGLGGSAGRIEFDDQSTDEINFLTSSVGINTSTPIATLDVRGNSGTTPAATISAESSFASLLVDNSGLGDLFVASKSGATKFVITNAGNVGIGTNLPTAALAFPSSSTGIHLHNTSGGDSTNFERGEISWLSNVFTIGERSGGTGSSRSVRLGTFASSGSVILSPNDVDVMTLNRTTGVTVDLTASSGTRDFNVESGKLIVKSTGNVGIGTTTPLATLDINGTASSTSTLTFRGTTDPKINILDGEHFGIQTSPGGDAGLTERLTVLNNGNVGIGGDTTPNALFNVGSTSQFQVNSSGAIAAATGITSSGTITFSGFTSNGGPLYTNGSGVLAQTTAGTATQCLLGGTTPTFGSCASGGADDFFDLASGLLYSGNTTVDFAIGGTASTSAKFAVLNVNSGTPTATLSAGAAGGTYLNATGTLATTAMQTLTLGGSTTGNVVIDSGSSSITLSDNTTVVDNNWIGLGGSAGRIEFDDQSTDEINFLTTRVGIGTSTPAELLHVYDSSSSVVTSRFENAGSGGQRVYIQGTTGDAWAHFGDDTTNWSIGVDNSDADSFKISRSTVLGTNDALTITTSNNVGINTTSPLATLDVRGNTATTPGASVSANSNFAALVADNRGNGDIFTASSSGLNRFVITQNGNVGIGTNLPSDLLTVSRSAANSTGGITIDNTLAGGYSGALNYKLTVSGASPTSYTAGRIEVQNTESAGGGFIAFSTPTTAALTTLTESMRIQNGNVGIGGDTTPNALFNVGSTSQFQVNSSGAIAAATGITSSGTITFSGFTSNGGPLYTNGSGVLAQVTAGTTSQCLLGGTTPSFGSCATGDAVNFWTQANGTLYAGNTTVDLLVGGISTAAAKFAFINVNSGNPTASISGNLALAVPTTAGANTLDYFNGSTLNFRRSPGGDAGVATTMFLARDGNVGIGTTSPVSTLSVAGNIMSPSSITATDSLANQNYTGSFHWDTDRFSLTNFIRIRLGGNSNPSGFGISDFDTAMRFWVERTGNVGINTTAPIATLDVRGLNATTPAASISANSNFAALVVDNIGNGDLFTASSSGLNRFVVKQNGNIGVGTNLPTGLLHVAQNVPSTSNGPTLKLENTNTVIVSAWKMGVIDFASLDSSTNLAGVVGRIELIADQEFSSSSTPAGANTNMIFRTNTGNAGTLGEVMRLTYGGNVGIGTTTPTAKLDVAGDASTSASLVFRSTATIDVLGGNRLDFQTSPGGDAGLTARMTLLNNGNVGIGTTTPTNAPLEVYGTGASMRTTWTTTSSATSGGPNIGLVTNDGAAMESGHRLGFLAMGGAKDASNNLAAGSAGIFAFAAELWSTNETGSYLTLETTPINTNSRTEKVRIQDDGNVGIGITAPVGLLAVEGKKTGQALVQLNETGNQDIFTASASGTTRFVIANSGAVTLTGNLALSGDASEGLSGGGLTDCDASGSKLLWDSTTNKFSCGTDRASFQNVLGGNYTNATTSFTDVDSDADASDDLGFSIGANETWIFQIHIQTLGVAAADDKYQITAPAGATCDVTFYEIEDGAQVISNIACDTSSGTLTRAAQDDGQIITGTVVNGSTPGTVQLQYGQVSASGTTTIYAGSYILAYRVDGADLAETYYAKDEYLPPATVLSIDPSLEAGVRISQTAYDKNLIGVVTTKPGLVTGDANAIGEGTPVMVALAGRVPVKVNTQNGPILPGDYLTSSSTPGVAMKATKAGPTIGKALEGFQCQNDNACEGIILMFVNTSWYDPGAYLADTGEIQIEENPSFDPSLANLAAPFVLKDPTGGIIDRVGAFSDAVIANLRVGNITIAGKSLEDYILAVVQEAGIRNYESGIVSPIAQIDRVYTNTISPLAENKAIVVTGDLEVSGNASISGTLTADKIVAREIEGLDARLKSLNVSTASPQITNITNVYQNTQNTQTASDSASQTSGLSDTLISQNTADPQSFLSFPTTYDTSATMSAALAYADSVNALFGRFDQGLISLGGTSLSDTTVTGQLAIGTNFILTDGSINVLGADLELQPLKQGGISFLSGLVRIDIDGNLTVQKDVRVNGTLYAGIISPVPDGDLIFRLGPNQTDGTNLAHNSEFIIQNSSSSAVLSVNQLGDLIASGSGTFAKLNLSLVQPAIALSETEIIASGSAGVATISAQRAEITIRNPQVSEKSLIYITPVGSTGGLVPYLLRQVPGESFTIGVPQFAIQKIPFNWLIIN